MYHSQFPDRQIPDHRIFQPLHRETRSFRVTRHNARGRKAARSPSMEESILNVVADRPESSTRAIAHHVNYGAVLDIILETSWREDAEQLRYGPHTSEPAPGIIVWGGIGYHSRTPLVRITGTLNSQRYISEVLEPVVLPNLQGLATIIFQQDNARPHVPRIVQRFFVNHQIELLPWPARSPDLSLIEKMCFMVAQRLTQMTPPAVTSYQLWQRMEAACSAVPQEHIHSLLESMPRRVASVISNNGGYSGY
ncbi:transposable element Tcb1 transposase [Trichonephila clavipes]|nr:transposable element Tcb1 transposase [Trichonephila clavipes]